MHQHSGPDGRPPPPEPPGGANAPVPDHRPGDGHDPLTGLAGRRLMLERITRRMAETNQDGSTAVLLFLGIDRFHVVNDGLGSGAGDELLRVVSRRLHRCLGSQHPVARISDDRFAVLLDPASDLADALASAERLRRALAEPVVLGVAAEQVFVDVSIGVHPVPSSGTAADVLRDAESAMHRAKRAGGARTALFDPRARDHAVNRLHAEGALRSAVRHHQLLLHYQPVLSVAGRHIVGAEALLRWQHPQRGLVGPMEVVPLAEEMGLIHEIGRWALRQAVTDAVGWQGRARRRPSVSVNVSGLQLRGDFAPVVESALGDAALDPARLVLEITESSALEDVDITELTRLRTLGVRIALDDFGTGYSSLGRLHELPVDVLKIDRSFVARLGQSADDDRLVRAIVDVARSLDLTTVAEGVERPGQLAALEALGCDAVQGFLLGKPSDLSGLRHRLDLERGRRAR